MENTNSALKKSSWEIHQQ